MTDEDTAEQVVNLNIARRPVGTVIKVALGQRRSQRQAVGAGMRRAIPGQGDFDAAFQSGDLAGSSAAMR